MPVKPYIVEKPGDPGSIKEVNITRLGDRLQGMELKCDIQWKWSPKPQALYVVENAQISEVQRDKDGVPTGFTIELPKSAIEAMKHGAGIEFKDLSFPPDA